MDNILVWSKNGKFNAAEISDVPNGFTFDGRWFDRCEFDLGDVDYLRNEKGQLVGFCYLLGDSEERDPIVSIVAENGQSYVEGGCLYIFLHPCQNFEIQTVQAIGTFIYYDDANSVILIVPYWGKGELAFNLTPDEIPVPCNL